MTALERLDIAVKECLKLRKLFELNLQLLRERIID